MRYELIKVLLITVVVVVPIYELEEPYVIGGHSKKDGDANQSPFYHFASHIPPSNPRVRFAFWASINRFIIVYDDFSLFYNSEKVVS